MGIEEKADSLEIFRSAPIPKAVLHNTVPAMAAMLLVLVYNLADTYFVGQTHDSVKVASVSLAMPVFLVFMALGTIFGIGGTSVISRAMGEGRRDYAKKVCSFCMWGCAAVGVTVAVLMVILIDPVLSVIGADKETWEYVRKYLLIVSGTGPCVLISNCYANIIRTEGKAGTAMIGQFAGNILNIILDPILILFLGWGVAGAAIATAVSNVFSTAYYIGYFLTGKSMLSIHPGDFSMKEGILTGVLAIGIPASLGDVLMSVSNIVANRLVAEYGNMALAGFGVALKFTMATGVICIGFGQGVQPLLGYCVGARNYDRYKKSLRFSSLCAFALSSVLTAVCYLFIEQMVGEFLTEPDAFRYAVRFAKIMLSTSFLFGLFYVLSSALQAMGAATAALIANISRQGLIYIPMLWLLNTWLGVDGIMWAQPVADVLSVVLVIVLTVRTQKNMFRM